MILMTTAYDMSFLLTGMQMIEFSPFLSRYKSIAANLVYYY